MFRVYKRNDKGLYLDIERLSNISSGNKGLHFTATSSEWIQTEQFDKNCKINVLWFTHVKKELAEMDTAEEAMWNRDIFRKRIEEFKSFKEEKRRQRWTMWREERKNERCDRTKKYWEDKKARRERIPWSYFASSVLGRDWKIVTYFFLIPRWNCKQSISDNYYFCVKIMNRNSRT